MSSDGWQNDPTNLLKYLMLMAWTPHDKLFQPWLLSEKVIFWETHFSHLAGFYAPKYQVFQMSATSLQSDGFQTDFFFLGGGGFTRYCLKHCLYPLWTPDNTKKVLCKRNSLHNELVKKNKLKPKPN